MNAFQLKVEEARQFAETVKTVKAAERKLETLAKQREAARGRLEMATERRKRTSRLRGAAELRIEAQISLIDLKLDAVQRRAAELAA